MSLFIFAYQLKRMRIWQLAFVPSTLGFEYGPFRLALTLHEM
jgi:hypothetical protein